MLKTLLLDVVECCRVLHLSRLENRRLRAWGFESPTLRHFMVAVVKTFPAERFFGLSGLGVRRRGPALLKSGERLGAMDAMLLYLETATSSSNIGLVCRFDGPLPFEEFVRDFECRRIAGLPRFRQVVVPVPLNLGFPTWEDDPNFVLSDHLHRIDLEPPGSKRALNDAINETIGRRINLERPPWAITVVNGLEDGGAAVIILMHHCITDGAGVTKVLDALFDSSPVPFSSETPSERAAQASPLPGPLARVRRVFSDRRLRKRKRPTESASDAAHRKAVEKEQLKAFGDTMIAFMRAPGIRLPFNAPLSGGVHYGGVSFEIGDLRQIARSFGGTINDVVLAVLAGAIDRLATDLGIEVNEKFCRVYQAANARSDDEQDDWGNRLAFMPALVPLGLTDVGERLRQTAAYTQKTKERGVRAAADRMVRLFQSKLPPPLAKLGLKLMLSRALQKLGSLSKRPPGFNIYVTNVRLPEFRGYLGGRRMIGFEGYAPLVPNTGVTCAAVSYDGRIHFGMTADRVSMPDVEGFGEMIQDSFEELFAASKRAGPSPTAGP